MFTIIDDGTVHALDATIEDGTVRLTPEALAALGWELHPEGLCREGLCIPMPPGEVDLATFARVLDRPLALDLAERAAYLGVSAGSARERCDRSPRRISRCPISRAARIGCPSIAGRRFCSSHTRRGEGAVSTCPCGRRSTR